MLKKISTSKSNFSNNCLFSILIPSWNNLDYLKLCIYSIQKNSRYKHQIIVHVNEGIDGTLKWIKKEKIDFSYSKENIGICFALNVASSLVTTPYIVYFNDDMYACPDWDYFLYEEIKAQKTEFFFLSSTLIEPAYSKNLCTISPYNFGDNPQNFQEKELLSKYKFFKKKDWNGATWPPNLVPKKLWDIVGGYSIEFSPGMYSDPDFSMKLWRLGVRNFKGLGRSRIYHFMSKTTKKINNKPLNNGRALFQNKWGISSNIFTSYYLRRGQVWRDSLTEPSLDFITRLRIVISKFRIFFSFK